jgi:hypothetical protein
MNRLKWECSILFFLLLFSTSSSLFVRAQEVEYPVVVVEYRELRLVPEDFTALTSIATPFSNEPELVELLDTALFWEPLGSRNGDFTENESLSTYGIVAINETGFYETLVGLSMNNQSLEWAIPLNSSIAGNFSKVVITATDFFANDDLYWGLCEEIVVIPGILVGHEFNAIWRLNFHLVAESEQWTLLIDTSGNLIDTLFVTIPCPLCPYGPLVIILTSIAITGCFVVIIYLRKRKGIT